MSKRQRRNLGEQDMAIAINLLIAEQTAINNRYLEDFTRRAFVFMDALSEVKVAIGQIEILFVAKGGEKTANAMGDVASRLVSAVNTLEQKTRIYAQNPFATIHQQNIGELISQCEALRNAANIYATARPEDRPVLQRRMASAISEAKPYIAKLFNTDANAGAIHDELLIAEMLAAQKAQGKHIPESLKEIQKNAPGAFLRYFGVAPAGEITETEHDRARQLMKRWGVNL